MVLTVYASADKKLSIPKLNKKYNLKIQVIFSYYLYALGFPEKITKKRTSKRSRAGFLPLLIAAKGLPKVF